MIGSQNVLYAMSPSISALCSVQWELVGRLRMWSYGVRNLWTI